MRLSRESAINHQTPYLEMLMLQSTVDMPVLGAALILTHIEPLLTWVRDSERDLELQDFCDPAILEGDWQSAVSSYKSLLDGHQGRVGIHGPYWGFDMGTHDPDFQALAQKRFLQGLNICEALGATHMVVHSPFNHWHHQHFYYTPDLRDRLFEASHTNLMPAVKRAEEIGCTLMIENITDVDPAERVRLVESFDSDAVRVSLDTGHAHLMRGMADAPPVDYFVTAGGSLLDHLHLQDADGHADRHWLPGDGSIDWRSVFEALAAQQSNPRLIIEVMPERTPGLPACVEALEARGLAR